VQELVNLSPEEMASDEKRQQNAKIRQEVAADLVRGQTQQASTDMFQCSRCKQKKCTYYVSGVGWGDRDQGMGVHVQAQG
jgi:transcription elongation factor S-II